MKTILIVDDDTNCALLWARILTGQEVKLLFAQTLEEAIEKMGGIPPPDLVLLDLKLPPYGAEQTLPAVNALRQFNPNLAVIAVSGMPRQEIVDCIETAGVIIQGIITKDEAQVQANLLTAVQKAMASGRNYKDTMTVLETASKAIEKKRTDRIDIGRKTGEGPQP